MPSIALDGGAITVFSLILGAVVSGLLALFKLLMGEKDKSYAANDTAWAARYAANDTGWGARYAETIHQADLRYAEMRDDRDFQRAERQKVLDTQGQTLTVVRDMVAVIKAGVEQLAFARDNAPEPGERGERGDRPSDRPTDRPSARDEWGRGMR